MANICDYKILAIGTKEALEALVKMMPIYTGDKDYFIEKDGDKFKMVLTGDCKWSVDQYTVKHEHLRQLTKEEILEIQDGQFWDHSLAEKSLLLGIELYCNSLAEGYDDFFDEEELENMSVNDFSEYEVYINGENVYRQMPEEIKFEEYEPENPDDFPKIKG